MGGCRAIRLMPWLSPVRWFTRQGNHHNYLRKRCRHHWGRLQYALRPGSGFPVAFEIVFDSVRCKIRLLNYPAELHRCDKEMIIGGKAELSSGLIVVKCSSFPRRQKETCAPPSSPMIIRWLSSGRSKGRDGRRGCGIGFEGLSSVGGLVVLDVHDIHNFFIPCRHRSGCNTRRVVVGTWLA